jgi:p38 MAP kinase
MKPFSTPVLSKRTYRELKLLKHIQHENVRLPSTFYSLLPILPLQIISLSDVFISPLEDMWVSTHYIFPLALVLFSSPFLLAIS